MANISIPNSVTSIGQCAFSDCSGLKSVELPNSISSIEQSVFRDCSGLTGISIPSSVTSIGSEAFRGCTSLKNVKISDSVTSIGNSAFYNCSGITDIDIPNGVEKIESSAFSGCTELTNVVIGKSVKSIGNNAFADCVNIEQVVSFVRMIFDINKDVFSNKTYLNATLYVPEGRMKAYQAATGWQNFVYMEEGVPSAIQDIFIDATNESEIKEVARYNANGTQISAPIKGLNFIKYSDGTVKKVFVK